MDEDDDKPDRHHDLAWWLLWAAIAILGLVGLNSFFRAATAERARDAGGAGVAMASTPDTAEG